MKTIRGRLLSLLLVGLAIVVTGGGASVYWIARGGFMAQLDHALEVRALTVANLVKFEPDRLIFEAGDAPEGPIAETYFELRTMDGRTLKRSPNLGEQSLGTAINQEPDPRFADMDLPDGVPGRIVSFSYLPRMDEDDWEGIPESQRPEPERLVVAAAMSRGAVDQALASLRNGLILVGALVGVTAFALVILGVRWGLAPLTRLTSQLGNISGDDVAKRIDGAGAPSELTPICDELNAMLARVQATIDRERSFADAAAHELRTPLAELRTLAEVALRWPDAQRSEATMNEVLGIGREIERLVESLLVISRVGVGDHLDAGAGADLSAVVEDVLRRMNGEIERKELSLRVEVDSRPLAAPREALEIIVRNLIDNAVHYTPARGSIVIDNRLRNGSTGFRVENGPVALTDEQLPRVFESFWRADASRGDRKHVGLGLTVVERVASAVGWRIVAELADKRLRIEVWTDSSAH